MSNSTTTIRESKAVCLEKIHALLFELLYAGHTEDIIVDAVINELYGTLLEPNIVEPKLEECRRQQLRRMYTG